LRWLGRIDDEGMTSSADALPRFGELRSRVLRAVAAGTRLKRWLTTTRHGRWVLSAACFLAGKAADEVFGAALRCVAGA
jgi:hypothetical protein